MTTASWVSAGTIGNRARQQVAALALVTLAFLAIVVPAASARASDLPTVTDPVYFQTQGPNALIARGDYYSASAAQGGMGSDHLLTFATPMFWPAGHPTTVSIYDPESYGGILASGLPSRDEVAGVADSTKFWVVERPSGTTMGTKDYPSGTTVTDGKWDQIVTFTPVAGATYEIHSTSSDNDDNAWRARVTYDPDCAVGSSTCTAGQLDSGNEVDNLDGLSGTGDEILLHPVRAAYQHDISPRSCSDLFFFVAEGATTVSMRNFDLDGGGTVLYTRPDGTTVNGAVSANGAWANDAVSVNGAANSGWWKVQFCATPTNLYVFESTTNAPLYMGQLPGAPKLSVTKTDGVTTAEWGQALTFTINVANTSALAPNPGSAVGVVVRDTVPTGLTYTSCDMGGAAGSCAESGGVVTWTLTDPIAAGASIDLGLSTTANWGFSGTVTNTAVADYNDAYGNNYPDVSGTDSADTIEPPSFVVTKTSDTGGTLVDAGDRIKYTVEIENPTTSGHTNVVVTDALPAGTTYVPGSTVVTFPGDPVTTTATDDFSSQSYSGGAGWTGPWTEFGDDGGAASGRVYVWGTKMHFDVRNAGVVRTVSVANATSANLSFTLSDDGCCDLTANDLFGWGISVDGGAYQQLGARAGNVHTSGTRVTADLSSYLPATTIQVSFRGLTGMSGAYFWYQVDDVELTVTTPGPDDVRTNAAGGTLSSGEPLTLVTAVDGIDLPAGQTMTVTYEVEVTSPVASATQRYLTNTATVTSDADSTGRQGSVTDELDRTPILQVVKTGPASALVGDSVTYNFAVSHASASDGSPVSAVAIVDDVAGTPTYVSGDDGDGILEVGETWSYTASYTILDSDPRPLVNHATVDGADLNGQPVPTATAQHSTDVAVPAPSILLTKTTSDTLTAGGTIHYSITAQNTGNVTLTGVQISDTLTGIVPDGTCDAVTLTPTESTTCAFTYVATQADVDAGSLTNAASVVGTAPSGDDVADTDAVTLTSTASASISLTKTTTAAGFVSGDVITYRLTAANTGGVTLHDVSIVESLVGAAFVGTCDPATLAPNATLNCTVDYTTTQMDVDAGRLANSATVTGTAPAGTQVTDTASVDVPGVGSPAIGVAVTVDSKDYFKAGDILVFTVVTTNSGPITLQHSTLTATLAGADTSECDALDRTLAPGASMTCHVTYVIKPNDMLRAEVRLSVVAQGESATAVRATAVGDRNSVPVVALAFTGYDPGAQTRDAGILLLSGLALMVLVRRRRKG